MPKHAGGAPRKDFDWDLVDSLAILQADLKFIAERLILKDGNEVNQRSLEAKMKFINRRINERFGFSYVQYRTEKREISRIKLRQKMFDMAVAGNVPLMIFLSKQEEFLGYADRHEVKDKTPQEDKTITLKYKIDA